VIKIIREDKKMLRGTFDQDQLKTKTILMHDLKTKQAPQKFERVRREWVFLRVCVTGLPYTTKAMPYLTWEQEFCQPLDWPLGLSLFIVASLLQHFHPFPWCSFTASQIWMIFPCILDGAGNSAASAIMFMDFDVQINVHLFSKKTCRPTKEHEGKI
jgi:hypothetical protein